MEELNLTEEKRALVDAATSVNEAMKKLTRTATVSSMIKLHEVYIELEKKYMWDYEKNPLLSKEEIMFEKIQFQLMTGTI